MKKTTMIDKSNFDERQYRADLDTAYRCGRASLVEELEKIKAEIMNIGNWRETYEVPNGYVVECLNIIDKHISELKGENNGQA